MEIQKERLSLIEASCIIAGLGVGGGVMAVPYLASLNGFVPIVIIMAVTFSLSILLHLFIAEIVVRDGGDFQLVEVFSKYLFRGKWGTVYTWLFFGLIVVNFYALLAGYIVGAGEILLNLVGMPLRAAEITIYLAAAGVVFFGLKALGVVEKYAIGAIAVLVVILSLGSVPQIEAGWPLFRGGAKESLALYGMLMFTLSCFFSIPQAARGLSWNRRLIPRAVIFGITINLVLVFSITAMTLLVSDRVTQVAIIGWSKSIGPWAFATGSLFVLLAILTSYWSVSYALAVILEERMKWPYRTAWLAATLPTLVLAISGWTGFLGFMRLAGGAIAVMLAVLVVPTLRSIRKNKPGDLHRLAFAPWDGAMGQILIILAYLAAAVGSMVPLD